VKNTKGMMTLVLGIVLMLVVSGCGKAEEEKTVKRKEKPSQETTTPSKKTKTPSEQQKTKKGTKPSLAYEKASVGGLHLGMPFEECKKIMIEKYGNDIVMFENKFGNLKLRGFAEEGDKIFDFINNDSGGGSSIYATKSSDGSSYEINFTGLANTDYMPETVCLFSSSPRGFIASIIFKRTKFDGGIIQEELKKKIFAKYGKYNGMKADNYVWLLKPAPSNALNKIIFPLQVGRNLRSGLRLKNNPLCSANAWMVYNIEGNGDKTNYMEALCMDLELVVQGLRLDYIQTKQEKALQEAEELKKATQKNAEDLERSKNLNINF